MTFFEFHHPAHPLPIEGLINFRDVGGVVTLENGDVRPGLVFRSDSLDGLSPRATEQLTDLGVGRVIDLRSAEEIEAHGRVGADGIEWVNHSIGAPPSAMREWFATGQDPMAANYGLMTTDYASEVIRVLERIADATTPLVVHCTSGKDRTGVVSALVQLLLGVPFEVVVAEYSASSRNVTEHFQTMSGKYPEMIARIPPDQRLRMAGTDPAWLAVALAPIDDAGGAERWLNLRSGSDELAVQLRRRLLSN